MITHLNQEWYDIPSKTKVFVNACAIQRDPTIWERPKEYLSKRFENNLVDFKGQNFEFIPFGGGIRGCPGLTSDVASCLALLMYRVRTWT